MKDFESLYADTYQLAEAAYRLVKEAQANVENDNRIVLILHDYLDKMIQPARAKE
jgi:hypothetical protein